MHVCQRASRGVLLWSAEEEMHRWKEHFQTVLNHEEPLKPLEAEPNDELKVSLCPTGILMFWYLYNV